MVQFILNINDIYSKDIIVMLQQGAGLKVRRVPGGKRRKAGGATASSGLVY